MTQKNKATLCADEALEISEEQVEAIQYDGDETYRVMADAMPQIVWSGNRDATRDYFNQRWFENTRMNAAQTKGWGWLSALQPEDAPRCQQAWSAAAGGSEAFECEYRLLCAADGSYRWHIERAMPVFDTQGQIVKWFGTCTDIDELKQAQQKIDALNVRLRLAMTETHHRVKNNLQIISAMVDMQLMNDQAAIPVEEFRRLGSHVRTLAAVHDILTKESKEATSQQLISLEEIMEQLLPLHQLTAPHCHITAHIADVQLPGRQGTSLALVLNELISNAIKHGKGEVEVIVAQEAQQITVSVCDDGPGFPPDFDPQKAANTGLELIESLVKWDLAGQVVFANQPQGGAQVTLALPITNPQRPQPQAL